ncbi:hypothetical protein GCM10027436_41300 [Actinophytocola sediminis]
MPIRILQYKVIREYCQLNGGNLTKEWSLCVVAVTVDAAVVATVDVVADPAAVVDVRRTGRVDVSPPGKSVQYPMLAARPLEPLENYWSHFSEESPTTGLVGPHNIE